MNLGDTLTDTNCLDINAPSYITTLTRVCDKIRNDNNWTEIRNGFLGDYFENKSFNPGSNLKNYIDDFVTLGFKQTSNEFITKHPLYNSKFNGYKVITYMLENDKAKTLFIYASSEKPKTTMNELRNEMISLAKQVHEIMNGKKIEIPSGKKANEIVMLKFYMKEE